MADFFKGLAGGFGTGLQFGQAMRQRRMEDDLAQEAGRYGVTEGAYGEGLGQNLQQVIGLRDQALQQLNEGASLRGEEVTPEQRQQVLDQYTPAMSELSRRVGLQGPDYSVASGPTNFATRQEARQAAAPLRAEGLAGVYRQYGDVAKADELEARAFDQQRAIAREARDVKSFETQQKAAEQQGLLTGAQLTDIQRKQNLQAALDLRLADINSQTFEKPEMRTQAILSLVEELQGPQAAAQLRESYSKDELTQISLQAKKFDEGYRQARSKGVLSAMDWFDEQNTSFKLERDPKNPFRVIQVNTDGSRTLFADAKNERELGMIVDAKAKPGGWLELAKFDLDQKKADDLAKYYRDVAGSRGATGLKQKVADFKEVYGRDPTEEEKGVLAGLTTKAPNKPEADRDAWLKAEQKLIENDATPEAIEAQRTAFFVRRGYAPAAARQVLEAGVNPATGKPLTRSDVDAYNKTYPQTPVDPGSLPWLPSPEREARRQGLINQIPK